MRARICHPTRRRRIRSYGLAVPRGRPVKRFRVLLEIDGTGGPRDRVRKAVVVEAHSATLEKCAAGGRFIARNPRALSATPCDFDPSAKTVDLFATAEGVA